ncbi:DUF3592 domain-containing protein [Teredinibacter sp. KSP-S5-2]|uniref:DUF3592 domain-containing protein n=1 Tax=Teredinibacter sp. KSP-S5-2 TaxID=3034506 RepID=UPI002934AB95|nr:DUF3592 domain-containing protein [Teredinibacter sp. KSP-S5-2]WNO11277.1 DUF3592 domain-containing protein [Teredinibacter sp. KSP-S5-2]
MPESIEFIIKLIFVAVGIVGGLYSLYSILLSQAANSWSTVSGKIEFHGVEESRDSDGDLMYEAKVEYSYEFRGRRYTGKRIGFGLGSWNIKWLVWSAYREATKMAPRATVFVNPRNPKLATLLKGIKSFHVVNVLFFTGWNIVVYKVLTSGSI